MKKEDLLNEIKEVEKAYYIECNNNGGHEGSILSLELGSQLTILTIILEKFFEEEYIYQRMIF